MCLPSSETKTAEPKEKIKILFVEDDLSLQRSLAYILEKEGFSVICTRTGEDALALVRKERPELVLLDLILPGMDGFGVSESIKKDPQTMNTCIIMLTGRGMLEEIVKGLELYADDYITKPFEPRILLARIRAVLRRNMMSLRKEPGLLEFDDLVINLKAYAVLVDGEDVKLTKTEFDIVSLLAGKPNQVFSRARILEYVRADNLSITERVVDYQITGLRKKLGTAAEHLKTVRGVGYKFEV
jgi:two-component system alkaline phosphatase synthesis response regulator PhoP